MNKISVEENEKLVANSATVRKLLRSCSLVWIKNNGPITQIAETIFGDESYAVIINILNGYAVLGRDKILMLANPTDVNKIMSFISKLPKLTGAASVYVDLAAASGNTLDFNEE